MQAFQCLFGLQLIQKRSPGNDLLIIQAFLATDFGKTDERSIFIPSNKEEQIYEQGHYEQGRR
jgi:hypothetical protein